MSEHQRNRKKEKILKALFSKAVVFLFCFDFFFPQETQLTKWGKVMARGREIKCCLM